MFGNNEKLNIENRDGKHLKVTEIFHTIQGEGPNAGRVAIFIRLSGCNLACSFCDTQFDKYVQLAIQDILEKVLEEKTKMYSDTEIQLNTHRILAVITGGEPFRQNIGILCQLLEENGFEVQIETNGTLYFEVPHNTTIVCSPKIVNNTYFPIRHDVLQKTIALKFIISSHLEGYGDIQEVGQQTFNIPVYVQPMDEYDQEKNSKNIDQAIKVAIKHNAIISMQLHKIMNIR
ncbi:putative 7-carboxy-7-deazaguanine synthase [Candidatus Fokinia solitaria]|uniref:7-carboxy-7-deazaguanine synthase n=1 Tax=Candidatus Fokinia solitaria TaxID=1802984 RepID=A0A2U8BSJ2_9RICK|nr:7-carboxy-7-deazaguanine synthase QueE [Candidatus Fokinia solitaria]AWD33275.1 putative 7-carboxy-7-deazaguanine synthase [Candidatus Fokinia solitaria]